MDPIESVVDMGVKEGNQLPVLLEPIVQNIKRNQTKLRPISYSHMLRGPSTTRESRQHLLYQLAFLHSYALCTFVVFPELSSCTSLNIR